MAGNREFEKILESSKKRIEERDRSLQESIGRSQQSLKICDDLKKSYQEMTIICDKLKKDQ